VERDITGWADIELKYAGYLSKEQAAAQRVAEMEHLEMPVGIDYSILTALSTESREKLNRVRPRSLGQACRIPGVSRSDIQNLVMEVVRQRRMASPVSRETAEDRVRCVSPETPISDGSLPES
jgi:tRNA uridine 5-carboxymethylaminomethyl modification enzyme